MIAHRLCSCVIVVSAVAALSARAPGRVPALQGRARSTVTLADGDGKVRVETYCTSCHQLGNIVDSGGYTREGWQQLIATMIALPKDQSDGVVDYLAKNFPEQPRPKAVLVDGDAK